MGEVVQRVCARVLPVNPAGEVLLLNGFDPRAPESPYWFTIGGGVEDGESLLDAALRETHEETGIEIDAGALVGPFHRERIEFDWDRWHLVQDQTFFAVPLGRVEVSFAGHEALEAATITKAGWWAPAALRADGTAASESLPDIMTMAIDAVRRGVQ